MAIQKDEQDTTLLFHWMPDVIRQVLNRLNHAGFEAYVVGGCVRDTLLGRKPHDWDVCTAAWPEEVISSFLECRVHLTGIQHGTVLLIWKGNEIEITTFRTEEGYSDHRHPDQVQFVTSLKRDLARRDFTVNAMAYHPKQGIIDLFGGRQDLWKKQIRCVGEPKQRFQEDGLRILRALRFAAQYDFSIEMETARAMEGCKELLHWVAAERIFFELKGFLAGVSVEKLLLQHREIFGVFLPELCPTFGFAQHNVNHCWDVWEHTVRSVANAAPDPVLRLALLFHDVGKTACFSLDENGIGHCIGHSVASATQAECALRRLHCDRETLTTVVNLVRLHDPIRSFSRKSTCRLLSELGASKTKLLLQVMEADVKAQAPETVGPKMEALLHGFSMVNAVLAAHACFRKQDLALKGRDLLSLGLRPGIFLGSVLEQLFQLVLSGKLENQREVLLKKAQELIRKKTAD